MDEQRVRVRALVSGRVQGVWFRRSTAEAVAGTGVGGWVRNLDDGRVEAVFEGSPEAVEAALAYIAHGPEHAAVDQVETTSETPEGLTTFSER
jgi:acylphosphatase